MTSLETTLPGHPLLESSIVTYGQIVGDGVPAKVLPPRVSASLVIYVENSSAQNDAGYPRATIGGIREHPIQIDAVDGSVDRIQVKFTPWGFSRFTSVKPYALKERNIPADEVFPSSVLKELLDALVPGQSLDHRRQVLDRFFLKLYSPPSTIEMTIRSLAISLSENHNGSFGSAISEVNLSRRQVERYFQRYIGISPRMFQRLTRFERAKESLLDRRSGTLGDIGLASGYYDQAQFNRDFRVLSLVSPGNYRFCTPTSFVSG